MATENKADSKSIELNDQNISIILNMLTAQKGVDFSHYKPSTIYRRLEKRIKTLEIENTDSYLDYLSKNPVELDALFNAILIGVTSFFRDQDAFKSLEKCLSKIISLKKDSDSIRVWIPACSTGEEAYSIAIILDRLLGNNLKNYSVKIFGTDIDEKSIEKARRGVYSKSALEELPEDIVNKYFIQRNKEYELIKSIRQMVIYSKHDITINPPFIRMDLVSCRNLLIYFSENLQKQIIPTLHYSLDSNGCLFLGKSETIGQFRELFSVVDNKHRIFKKKNTQRPPSVKFSLFPVTKNNISITINEKQFAKQSGILEDLKETFFHTFDYPFVIINDSLNIQEIYGNINKFFKFNQGSMNTSIVKLIHPDLQLELRTILASSLKERSKVKSSPKLIRIAESYEYIIIKVLPVISGHSVSELFMVVFESFEVDDSVISTIPGKVNTDNLTITKLEHELFATREHLQAYIEELERANEEMQILNEELQSANEELQSTNEELETANEELQATNDEMQATYHELQIMNENLASKEEQLRISEANLNALFDNTLQAFFLIDTTGEIISANQAAAKLVKRFFKPGIKKGDFVSDLLPDNLKQEFGNYLEQCLKKEIVRGERQFSGEDGQTVWFSYNFTPVINEDRETNMVSFSILDITQLKQTQTALDESQNLLKSVFNATDTGICILDENANFVKVNRGYCNIYGYEPEELTGKSSFFMFTPEQEKIALERLKKMMAEEKVFPLMQEWQLIRKDGTSVDVLASSALLKRENGQKYLIASVRDITERKKYRKLLEYTQESLKVGSWEYNVLNGESSCTEEIYKIYDVGQGSFDISDINNSLKFFYESDAKKLAELVDRAMNKGEPYDTEMQIISAKGKHKWVRATCKPIFNESNKVRKLIGTFQDISTKKEAELQIEKLLLVVSKTHNAVTIRDAQGNIEWVNEGFTSMSGYTAEEVIGKNPLLVVDNSGEITSDLNYILSNLNEESFVSETIMNYRKDGSPYWVKLEVTPVFDKGGKIINYITIETDITERQVIEEQLRFQAGILENVRDCIIVTDSSCRIIYWNEGAAFTFGYTAEEMLGKSPASLSADQEDSAREGFDLSMIAPEYDTISEWKAVRKDEIEIWIELVTNEMIDSEGNFTGFICVVRDISERKKIEEKIKSAFTEKEVLMKEIHHRSKNNMQIISSLLNLQKNNSDIKKIKDTLNEAINRVKSMSTIHEILYRSDDLGNVKFSDYIIKIVSQLFTSYAVDPTRINTVFDIDDILLNLDFAITCGLIINELVSNALKYAFPDNKAGKIIISLKEIEKSKIKLIVQDNGIGLPKTGNRNNKTLGLYLVQSLIEQLDGTMETICETGTCFNIELDYDKKVKVSL